MFLDLKTKTSLLAECTTYECAYKLEDDFNELFEHVELESVLKDSSDGALLAVRSPTAHEDILKVASEDERGRELGEAGSCREHS